MTRSLEQIFYHSNTEAGFTTEAHPSMEETFNHMWEIMDTNHLTHELDMDDQEMIELAPDIPIPLLSVTPTFKKA